MGLISWFKEKFGEKPKKESFKASSIEPVSVLIPQTKIVQYSFINPRYPREWLLTIEKAVFGNQDLSMVFELFIDLANSGHRVQVIGKQAEEAKTEIDNLAARLNTDSLVNQLFAQLALYGAISIEVIVEEDLSGVQKVVRVPAHTIYFKYNEATRDFEPYQWIPPEDPIKLNPNTYLYIPLITLDGSPYAIPPFLASLSPLEVQEEFKVELRNLAKKIGLLGFFDIEIPKLEPKPTETETEYFKRLEEHLNKVAEQIAENIQKGIFLHYEGTKAEFKEIGGKASDVDKILAHINRWLITGAKAQPSLLGISEGITETWAVVSYEQFARQLQNYQRIVKRALEYIYKLHCALKGFDIEDINIIFNPVPKLKPEADIEAFTKKADAITKLIETGVITIDEAREMLGLNPIGGEKDARDEKVFSKVWDSSFDSFAVSFDSRERSSKDISLQDNDVCGRGGFGRTYLGSVF
jgi:hypothetical protein